MKIGFKIYANYIGPDAGKSTSIFNRRHVSVLDSIVVSIPACHAGDRGSIPRRGDFFLNKALLLFAKYLPT